MLFCLVLKKRREKINTQYQKCLTKNGPIFKKSTRTTLKLEALKQIRNAIKSGRLRPGDRVIEEVIAQEMGISRFPVREAIRLLENEGLLVSIPFKGAFVRHFDEKDLEELYTLRSCLEEFAIQILMTKMHEKTIKVFESIIKAMEKATKSRNISKLVSEDTKFHRTICELSGHTKLLEVWMSLEHQLRCFIALEEVLYEREDELMKTHYPVLEAIESGDIQLAQRSIREHLFSAHNILRNLPKRTRGRNHPGNDHDNANHDHREVNIYLRRKSDGEIFDH